MSDPYLNQHILCWWPEGTRTDAWVVTRYAAAMQQFLEYELGARAVVLPDGVDDGDD